MQFEGSHAGRLHNKLLQKWINPTSYHVLTLLSAQNLSDSNFPEAASMQRAQDEGGVFLIRAKTGMNPQVVEAFRAGGKRLQSWRTKPLKPLHTISSRTWKI